MRASREVAVGPGRQELEVLLVAVLLLAWALLDAARHPAAAYREAGWRTEWWLLAVVALPTLGPLLHLPVVRRRLQAVGS